MADQRISDLPEVMTLENTDDVPLVRGGLNRRIKGQKLISGLTVINVEGGGAFEVFDADGNSLGVAVGLRAPDVTLDGGVAVLPFMPLVRSEAQLAAMSPPPVGVLFYNSTTPR